MEEAPANKRLKTSSLLEEIISSEFLKDPENKLLYESYAQVKPFPYRFITNAFSTKFLQDVREEIKTHAKVNFKESDLFRVYQSMDLANLHGDSAEDDVTNDTINKNEKGHEETSLPPPQKIHPKDIPNVYQLRQVLYSEEFRHKMEAWTGLPRGTLTDQVDCAANCHIQGCHLLCHDDVIGTRIISYIIYLTDDDPEWSAEEGGALELYDSTEVPGESAGYRVPDAIPSATVLPIFNSMAFFQVQPGFSFHAVQEVLGTRPRLSLQGWFHAATPPENIELATLQRLKNKDGGCDAGPFTPFATSEKEEADMDHTTLSDSDRAYLTKYLNPTYLAPDAMQEICKRFEKDSSVQLRNFLSSDLEDRVRGVTTASTRDQFGALDSYRFGIDEEWKLIGPAHQQRFLEYIPDITASTKVQTSPSDGAVLHDVKTELFQSGPFARYLRVVTSLGTPLGYRGRIRRFRRGLDYTVAHYGILTHTSVLDATLCFCADRSSDPELSSKAEQVEADKEIEMLWASGDVGGFECYVAADDEDAAVAADEYNEEDDTELLSVAPSNNTLSLVFRDPGTMRFIKYVSEGAPSSRWDITMEYEVADDSDADNGVANGNGDESEVDQDEMLAE